VPNRLLATKVSEQELKAIDCEVRDIVNAAAVRPNDPEPIRPSSTPTFTAEARKLLC
jgi:hypothetical protein